MSDDTLHAQSLAEQARAIASSTDRSAFLDSACRGNTALRSMVDALLDDAQPTVGLAPSVVLTSHNQLRLQYDDVSGPTLPVDGEATASDACRTAFPEIPGFEILDVLGSGGMGVVYKARQQNLKRLVAIKMILERKGARDEGVLRFRAEAESVARLQHPNIVQIYEVGEYRGQPFLVLEYVEGATLTERLHGPPVPFHDAAEIVLPLARAMHYAHEQGIIHRDLKPGNVLMGRGGKGMGGDSLISTATHHSQSTATVTPRTNAKFAPKIMDFGLAKQLDAEQELTRTGAVLGTPTYMSPEQAAGNHTVGPATDVYSLGAILYSLLTGLPPFRGHSIMDTVVKLQRDEPVAPSKLRMGVPRDLELICLKCLEKEPGRRYASAEELADDLQRFLSGDPVIAQRPSLVRRARGFCRRHPSVAVAMLAAVLVLAIGGASAFGIYRNAQHHARSLQRVADVKTLTQLHPRFKTLLDIDYRQRHAAIEDWLAQAREIAVRGERHRTDLAELQHSPKVPTPADWQRQYDELANLVLLIDELTPPGGPMSQAERWLTRAPKADEIDEQWKRVTEWSRENFSSPLEPQPGFYPLGQDPRTRLWEFVDLRLGLAPVRGDDGQWNVAHDNGAIFVLLPGGAFLMGTPEDEVGHKSEEGPRHRVQLRPFYVSKYEITQAQWQRVMGQNPSQTLGPSHPVDTVSWRDCEAFCLKLDFRLPTEAQFEYACRGGTDGPYSSADSVETFGWFHENSDYSTHRVGEKAANPFGLYDIHGNVLEWCRDTYASNFYGSPEASAPDPINLEDAENFEAHRVLRGGSYEGQVTYLRSGDRYHERSDLRWRGFGLRPIRELPR